MLFECYGIEVHSLDLINNLIGLIYCLHVIIRDFNHVYCFQSDDIYLPYD